jgi:hypothetical protein
MINLARPFSRDDGQAMPLTAIVYLQAPEMCVADGEG